MTKRTVLLVALLLATRPVPAVPIQVSPDLPLAAGTVVPSVQTDATPNQINGVEISTIKGWFAALFGWAYIPEQSTVHPTDRIWRPWNYQSKEEVIEQNRLLVQYGSGADVLEYNPNPASRDRYQWTSSEYLTNDPDSDLSRRPFFLMYEHAWDRFIVDPVDNRADMDLPYNRQVFREDIDRMFQDVIYPYHARYVTWNKRAIIFIWATLQMKGDLAGLLDEMRVRHPVAFIGSVSMMALPSDVESAQNLKALDGFMEYGLLPPPAPEERNRREISSTQMVRVYVDATLRMNFAIKNFEKATGRKYLWISTFQAAFDDTKVPGRDNLPMYPRTRKEMEDFAKFLRDAKKGGDYSPVGPLAVGTEFFEGAAVIKSQCLPETVDRPGRFVGCGTVRLEILKQYFGGGR